MTVYDGARGPIGGQNPEDDWPHDPATAEDTSADTDDNTPRTRQGRRFGWVVLGCATGAAFLGGMIVGARIPPVPAKPMKAMTPKTRVRLENNFLFGGIEMTTDVLGAVERQRYDPIYVNKVNDPDHPRGIEVGMAYREPGTRYDVDMFFDQQTDGSIIPLVDTFYELDVTQYGCELPKGACNDWATRQTYIRKLVGGESGEDKDTWYGSDTLWSNYGHGSQVVFSRDTWLDHPEGEFYSRDTQVALSNSVQIDHVLGTSIDTALTGSSAMYEWDGSTVPPKIFDPLAEYITGQ